MARTSRLWRCYERPLLLVLIGVAAAGSAGAGAAEPQEVQHYSSAWLARQRAHPQGPQDIPVDYGWLPSGGSQSIEGSVRVLERGTEPWVLLHAGGFDADAFNVVHLRMRVSEGSQCTFAWEGSVGRALGIRPSISLPLKAGPDFHDYVFELNSIGTVWTGAITTFSILPSDMAARVEISECRVDFASSTETPRVEIAERTHEAFWGTQPPWEVTVPSHAVLDVSLGVPRGLERDAAHAMVRVEDNGTVATVIERQVPPVTDPSQARWIPLQADLDAYSGRSVRITFSVECPGATPGDGLFWGNPVVFSSGIDSAATPIILISCDTTRADHLSCYGYKRKTTPNLDRWSNETVLFEKAMTTSTWTPPSHLSMLTGLIESHHKAGGNAVLSKDIPTLAEGLRGQGYLTAAFVGCAGMLDPSIGLGRGFDVYDVPSELRRPVFETLDLARAWLNQHRRSKIFLFFHNYDNHGTMGEEFVSRRALDFSPYSPADAKYLHFSAPYRTTVSEPNEFARWTSGMRTLEFIEPPIGDKVLEFGIAGYDDAILSVDSALNDLFEYLKSLDLYDSSLIIVTGDHGEEFGEHGRYGHKTVYEECCHIPLMVKFPHGQFAGRRYGRMVQLVDLFPTVFDLLAMPLSRSVDGESLLGLLRDSAEPQDLAQIEARSQVGLRTESWKAVVDYRNQGFRFYNLIADPRERDNRATKGREALDTLVAAFDNTDAEACWVVQFSPSTTEWPVTVHVGAPRGLHAVTDLLGKTLGLNPDGSFTKDLLLHDAATLLVQPKFPDERVDVSLSSSADFTLLAGGAKPAAQKEVSLSLDPMESAFVQPATGEQVYARPCAAVWRDSINSLMPRSHGLSSRQQEQFRAAGYLDTDASAAQSGTLGALATAGFSVRLLNALIGTADFGSAARVIARMPRSAWTLAASRGPLLDVMARGLTAAPKGETEFTSACRKVLEDAPPSVETRLLAASFAERMDDLNGAAILSLAAVVSDPRSIDARKLLASILQKTEPADESLDIVRKALALAPDDAMLALVEARYLERREDLKGAVAACRKAAAASPETADVWRQLGELLRRTRDYEDALDAYRKAERIRPDDHETALGKAEVLEEQENWTGALNAYCRVLELEPGDVAAVLGEARALEMLEIWDEAIAAYREAVLLDGESARTLTGLGAALRKHSDLQGALEAFRRAIESDPTNAHAWDLQSQALEDHGDLDGAITSCRQMAALQDSQPGIFTRLGKLLLQRGEPDSAIDAFRKAQELDPKYLDAFLGLAQAYTSKHDENGTLAAYREAAQLYPREVGVWLALAKCLERDGDAPGALSAFQKAAEAAPQNVEAMLGRARVIALQGGVDEAAALYRKAVEADPTNAEAMARLAHLLETHGKPEDAVGLYRKAAELDPTRADNWRALGDSLRQIKDLDGAREAFQKARTLEPDNVETAKREADMLELQGDAAGAVAAYRAIAEAHADDAGLQRRLAVLLEKQHDPDGAIEAIRKAQSIDPKDPADVAIEGRLLTSKGDMKGAVAAYQKVTELQPDDAGAWMSLAAALQKQGAALEALEAFRKARTLDPQNAGAWFNEGLILVSREDIENAIAAFSKGAEIQPDDINIQLCLGDALRRAGKFDQAEDALKKVLAVDPANVAALNSASRNAESQSKWADAAEWCRKSIQIRPRDLFPRQKLAEMLEKQGDFKGAVDALAELLKVNPASAQTLDVAARIIEAHPDTPGALDFARALMPIRPSDGRPHWFAGMVLRSQGDLAGAIAELESALSIDQTLEKAAQLLEAIKREQQEKGK